MTALRVATVKAFECFCERCGHAWFAYGKIPKACARCKQIGWQTAPGLTGKGRPPKKRKRGTLPLGRPPVGTGKKRRKS